MQNGTVLLERERVVTPRVDEGQSKSRMRRKWLEHVLQVTGQKYMGGVKGSNLADRRIHDQ
jgi:hypothetical protein